MIDYKEAITIVQKKDNTLEPISCIELDDSFVISTNIKGEKDIVPDCPTYRIKKSNGDIELFMPFDATKSNPFENLEIMRKGKHIKI